MQFFYTLCKLYFQLFSFISGEEGMGQTVKKSRKELGKQKTVERKQERSRRIVLKKAKYMNEIV